jgi:MFS family permease
VRPRGSLASGTIALPMTPPAIPLVPPALRARSARIALGAFFLANGALGAAVLPRLPAIRDALGLSNAELGAAVAAMPVGGLLVGGFVGMLVTRFGSGRVATTAALAYTAALVGLALASSWGALAAAFLVVGAFDATMDAAQNAHAIGVQRGYGRSIMQGFHGMWSAGGMAGGAAGALAAAAGVPVTLHLAVLAITIAAVVLVASRRLLPASWADAPHREAVEPPAAGTGAGPARSPATGAAVRIHPRNAAHLARVLGPIAMLGILTVVLQGAAATWGAVFLADVLETPAGIAASAYVVYMAAMTLGRVTNDRWVDRFGGTRVVRVGALVGGSGIALVIVAGSLGATILALAGFALVGYGSSPMFPVLITAAGTRPGIPAAHGVGLASWMVRIGLTAAPAIVGVTADVAGLRTAFLVPLAAALAIAALAVPLTGGGRPRRTPAG